MDVVENEIDLESSSAFFDPKPYALKAKTPNPIHKPNPNLDLDPLGSITKADPLKKEMDPEPMKQIR